MGVLLRFRFPYPYFQAASCGRCRKFRGSMFERAGVRDLGGKFRILAELGQGGSSRVWLAAFRGPSGFNKLVVLKSMKEELKSEPELAQMFLNEARLAAQLNHPNIVQTNEVFEHEGLPVIV